MSRILLQFPEGLKQKAAKFAEGYEKEGHEVFLSASPCYGACDIALDEARWIKADKIVHFGHNRFMKNDLEIPVEYVEFKVDVEIARLAALLPLLEGKKRIALATTVQHVHQFDEMKRFFAGHGIEAIAGKGERACGIGQVLGCDDGAVRKAGADIDAIVFVGNGMFHPLAIGNASGKPVLALDPYSGAVRDIGKDIANLRKRRMGSIAKALSCKRFGVLLSTKPGQFNMPLAIWARDELRKHGLAADILVANELEPLSLNNFLSFDCYINTACPRMADDTEEIGKPVLNIDMLRDFFGMLGK